MKKITLIAFAFVTGSLFAQLPVGTAPQNKKAVLEEFTGLKCGYCPDGHQVADNIKNADPNNVIVVNIHCGYLSVASPGQPDMTTPEGSAIELMPGMGSGSYPAGNMSRHQLIGTTMSVGRGSWTGMAATVKAQPAYCNVATQGTLDPQTRVLTIQVEVYYTGNSPVATNYLNVFLLESWIKGYQSTYNAAYNPGNWNADGTYNHNHVLRKVITPTFGSAIPNTTSGTLYTTTLSYTIPATYGASGKTTIPDFENLELVAFVTESDRKTINADSGPIYMTNDAKAISASVPAMFCGTSLAPVITVQNKGLTPITSMVITPSIDNVAKTPTTFNGSIASGATATIALNSISNSNVSGNHTLTYTISSVAPAETYLTNNTAKTTFYSAASYMGSPVAEGFTATQYPPVGWATMNPNAGPAWTRNNQNGAYNLSSESTRYDFFSNTLIGDIDALMLPAMDLTGTTKAMSFDYAYSMRDENSNDKLDVMISDDCGATWTNIWSNSGTMLQTAMAPNGSAFIPTVGEWVNVFIDLSTVNKNLSQLLVKFMTTNDHGNYLYIDNINLGQKAASTVGVSKAGRFGYNVSVFPNPSNGLANVKINSPVSTSAKVSVISALGQVVLVKDTQLSEGANLMTIDVKDLASGLYSVVIRSENGSVTKMLTVTK